MSSSTVDATSALAMQVHVTDDTLSVELSDGRVISAPLAWYPWMSHATSLERVSWRLIGAGHGIHWPNLDEDISVAGLLLGHGDMTSLRQAA